MKMNLIFSTAMLCLISVTGLAQFFPKVDKPTLPEMSMLALQLSRDEDGKMGKIINFNFSGWAPAVLSPDGKVVPFRNFDAGADFTNIYYSENLTAGDYKLIGFYHVYTDFVKLDEFQKGDLSKLPHYGPFEDLPYHVKQLIPLKEPITVKLEPDKIMTFGSYAVKFKWISGVAGTTKDRYSVIIEDTSFTLSDSKNDTVLRYMKTWATPTWKKWNAKNAVTAL